MKPTIRLLAAAFLICLSGAYPATAAETKASFDFAIDEWYELEASDGGVTLHRIRLETVEGRLTKSTVARPYNSEYLETIRVQLDYTNETSQKWRARVTVRWLDEDGNVIDGISANEGLNKKSARKLVQVSLSTLKYGLERAKTLEVDIHYEP